MSFSPTFLLCRRTVLATKGTLQEAVEVVPKMLTKDTGIVLEPLEIPQETQMWAKLRNRVSTWGRWSLPRIRTIKCGVFWRSLPPHEKEERLWQFLTNSLMLFWTFAPAGLWGGDEESKAFIYLAAFLIIFRGSSLWSESFWHWPKLKADGASISPAHRDTGDTQQSGEGKESDRRSPGLSTSCLCLSHHTGSNHHDLMPALQQPPTWPPSYQICSRHCNWSPLQSTDQMRPLP